MKTTTVNFSCDYCDQSMSEFEYDQAASVVIKVNLPNPKGGCGQVSGIEMKLCNKCSESVGIVNLPEYHQYIDSQSRLRNTIQKSKEKILTLLKIRKE